MSHFTPDLTARLLERATSLSPAAVECSVLISKGRSKAASCQRAYQQHRFASSSLHSRQAPPGATKKVQRCSGCPHTGSDQRVFLRDGGGLFLHCRSSSSQRFTFSICVTLTPARTYGDYCALIVGLTDASPDLQAGHVKQDFLRARKCQAEQPFDPAARAFKPLD